MFFFIIQQKSIIGPFSSSTQLQWKEVAEVIKNTIPSLGLSIMLKGGYVCSGRDILEQLCNKTKCKKVEVKFF